MPLDAGTSVQLGSGGGFAALLLWLAKTFRSDYRSFKNKVWKRFEQMDDEMAEHVLLDAQTFATKTEVSALRDHLDNRFDKIQDLIIARTK